MSGMSGEPKMHESAAASTDEHPADFALRQNVYDAFRASEKWLREHETIVAVHPDDLTDELRAAIVSSPLTTLRETRHIRRGTLYVMHPGLVADLTEPKL